ncbi:MAG: trypsin-like peptidase domain-containing protein [Saprospiraceae bacterium]|nr:trypsin-like peptidase domain-containing protein [Saprospiraceae bacterium]MBK7523151.1 trypsin-like peptidase domain-containing protein [Saprospiraceae bacterium]MBK8371854.1 trypsin-like peptidase domain-containing protein [Saprospiraceae bacterium]MBK8853289.1 trypsin-like peptidase domain-containing protein [Saprospiraceae bacterium]MBP6694165.1 trypsin-like peptidase domain-containing protein [Saprospiraceae bacterium]
MKTFLQFFLAGILGGLVVFLMTKNDNDTTSLVSAETSHAVRTSFNSSPISLNSSLNFIESAKRSTNTVVHIYAEESPQLVQKKRQERRQSDPFSDFFNFEDFFGENFYRPKNGTGSGVIFNKQGYIITNNHVVGFADKIKVTDSEGKIYDAKKIGTDKTTDLAVLKIESNADIQPIRIGDSDNVQVGEWVLAVGNPFGYLTSTVTAGIVSAKGRSLDIIQGEKAIEDFIQTDAAINPGNSGGALVNLQGELIGINTAIATPTGVFAGYSFAIPSNIVKKVVSDIIENGGDIDRSTNIGIGGYDVNDELVKEFNLKLKTPSGFYVHEVDTKSAAQLGGILPGDVIIEINKIKIDRYEDIEKNLKLKKVGDKVEVKVNRDGKELVIPLLLKKSF